MKLSRFIGVIFVGEVIASYLLVGTIVLSVMKKICWVYPVSLFVVMAMIFAYLVKEYRKDQDLDEDDI